MARIVSAVVTATAPMRVRMDGDASGVTVPAATLASYAPVVGHRVRLELRTPLPPLVIGRLA